MRNTPGIRLALPRQGPSVGDGVVELSSGQPGGQLVDLDLAQWDVLLPVEHGRVVGAVDSLVVAWRKISQHFSSASLNFCNT